MAIESHPVPKIARTALALAHADFQRTANEIGRQACEALGLNPDDNWNINFDTGQITREVPDAPTKPELVAS